MKMALQAWLEQHQSPHSPLQQIMGPPESRMQSSEGDAKVKDNYVEWGGGGGVRGNTHLVILK